jgi:hypothetical protein
MAADDRQWGKSKRPSGNIYRPSDIRAWAKYWDCTQREVRDAARISGARIVDIQDWIKMNVAR